MGIKTGCAQNLRGKTAIVTGCNTGIGLQTARILCEAGAHVIMACRSVERAKAAKTEVTQRGGSAEVVALDLSDVNSIKDFATNFLKERKTLDILINNAGLNTLSGYSGPKVTAQDYEICMGTNFFGHFMLTALLMPALMAAPEARIVSLSSVTTWFASNKYQYYIKGASKTQGNYAASKLACLAMTYELQRRLDTKFPGNTVHCVAADPGFVASDIWRNYNVVFRKIAGMLALTTAEGAMTSVNAASLPGIKKGALYMPFSIKMSKFFKLSKRLAYDVGMPLLSRPFAGFASDAPAPKAKNAESNAALWDLSLTFCRDNGVPVGSHVYDL